MLHGLDERQELEPGAEQMVGDHTYGATITLHSHKTSLYHL